MTLDSSLIQIATTVAGSVAAVYAGLPWLIGKHSGAASTLSTVATVTEKVVASLEQTQGAASGAQKKALALDLVNTVLASLHVSAPAPFIDAAVEAAVLGLSMLQPAARMGANAATTYLYDAMEPPPAPASSGLSPPGAITITSGSPPEPGTGPSG